MQSATLPICSTNCLETQNKRIMKAEITINAPVFNEEKMADYLRIFSQMLLTAEGETVASVTIDGKEINPDDKYAPVK